MNVLISSQAYAISAERKNKLNPKEQAWIVQVYIETSKIKMILSLRVELNDTKKMRVKLKSISGESKRREKIKGIRITVSQKGTGTIYNILISLDFLFQFFQIRKGSLRLCGFLTSKYSQRSLF